MSSAEDLAVAIALAKETRELTELVEHAIAELTKANVPITPILDNWRLRRAVDQQQRRAELEQRVRSLNDRAPSRAQRAAEVAVASMARTHIDALPEPRRQRGARA